MRRSRFEQFGRRGQAPADNHARNRIAEILVQDFLSFSRLLFLQIRHFGFSDQLRTFKSEKLVKPAELDTGPVQVGRPDIPFFPGRGDKAVQTKRGFKILCRYHGTTSPFRK